MKLTRAQGQAVLACFSLAGMVAIGLVKLYVMNLDPALNVLIIAIGVALISGVFIVVRWRARREEAAWQTKRTSIIAPRPERVCSKCGADLSGVAPAPVNIRGLNVQRVTCPACKAVQA